MGRARKMTPKYQEIIDAHAAKKLAENLAAEAAAKAKADQDAADAAAKAQADQDAANSSLSKQELADAAKKTADAAEAAWYEAMDAEGEAGTEYVSVNSDNDASKEDKEAALKKHQEAVAKVEEARKLSEKAQAEYEAAQKAADAETDAKAKAEQDAADAKEAYDQYVASDAYTDLVSDIQKAIIDLVKSDDISNPSKGLYRFKEQFQTKLTGAEIDLDTLENIAESLDLQADKAAELVKYFSANKEAFQGLKGDVFAVNDPQVKEFINYMNADAPTTDAGDAQKTDATSTDAGDAQNTDATSTDAGDAQNTDATSTVETAVYCKIPVNGEECEANYELNDVYCVLLAGGKPLATCTAPVDNACSAESTLSALGVCESIDTSL